MTRKACVAIIVGLALALIPLGSAQENKGNLKLVSPTKVGSTVLPPGEYSVIHSISPTSGDYIQFSQIKQHGYGYLGMPIDRVERVVAAVNCSVHPLTAKAARTIAQTDGSRIVRLEIKGEDVAYGFQ